MQFTLAVLPPNCSRCDLSMTKIKTFSEGHAPRSPNRARFTHHKSHKRITSYSSCTPCITVTPPQKSWRRPWFKAKGVVLLPLDGACVVRGYSALSAICLRSYRIPLLRILRTGVDIEDPLIHSATFTSFASHTS